MKIFFGDVVDRHYDVITFILKWFNLKRPGVADFDDIIKTAVILIKKTFLDLTKVKRANN